MIQPLLQTKLHRPPRRARLIDRPSLLAQLEAGLGTDDNVDWLKAKQFRYLVVSRKRHRQFDDQEAVMIKEDGAQRIRAQRVVNAEADEVELYCHSVQREHKERGIQELYTQRFEAAPECVADLHGPFAEILLLDGLEYGEPCGAAQR